MRKRWTAALLSVSLLFSSFQGISFDIKASETKLYETTTKAAAKVAVNATNFPDGTFRTLVKKYDLDSDNYLSQEEIEKVESIYIPNQNITSLEGINYLTNLLELNCEGNELISLDVTKLSNLEILECGDNELTNLNIKGLSNLTKLLCGNNHLKKIDLTGVTKLNRLDCLNNELTSLDVTELTKLNNLDCSNNEIATLNISGLTYLEFLYCGNNQLTELDITEATRLKIFDCSNNLLEEIDVSQNQRLTQITVSGNKLISLDVSMLSSSLAFECNKNNREVYVTPEKLVQLTLPADFASKVSDLTGAEYDSAANTLTLKEDATIITYKYNIGHNKTAEFQLTITDTKKITMNPSKVSLYVLASEIEDGSGKEAVLSAKLFGFTSKNITWSSSNDSIATVDSNGRVKPISFGRAEVTVSAADDSSGEVITSKVPVYIYRQVENLEVSSIDVQLHTGNNIEPGLSVKANGTVLDTSEYSVEFENNKDVGEATVHISGNFPYNFSVSQTFKIQYDFTKVLVYPNEPGADEFTFKEYIYNGKHIKPGFTVKYGETLLTEGTDYSVSYSYYAYAMEYNPDNINIRTPRIDITGMGDYYGSLKKYYSILKKEVNTTDFSIAAIADQQYTGSALFPSTEIILKVSKRTLDSDDFNIEAMEGENNTEVGTAKVKFVFKNNYSGSYIAEFNIVPRTLEADQITIKNKGNPTYSGSVAYPDLEVSYDRDGTDYVLTQGVDYDIVSGSNSTKAGVADATVVLKGSYSGSKAFNYTITIRDAEDAEVTIADQTYTGSEIIPKATVRMDDTVLSEGTDYHVETIEDRNNTMVGSAFAKITFHGNYSGSKIVEYNIIPKVLEEANIQVSEIADQTYTGDIIIPNITVLDKTARTQLELGVDYTITADKESSQNAGTAYITINLQGNYSGSKKVSFTILKKKLTSDEITISGLESQVYTGQIRKPNPTVLFGSRQLTEDTDYTINTIENLNNKEVGTAYFMIQFIGNYSGSRQIEFEITKKAAEESSVNISFVQEEYEYTGSEILPETIVKYGEEMLTRDSDYVVELLEGEDNINAGEVHAKVTFIKNYSGSYDITYQIVPKTLDKSNVFVQDIENIDYTKNEILPAVAARDIDNNRLLLIGTDYQVTSVEGKNNTISGEAFAKLVFAGNYEGEVEVSFTITPRKITHSDIVIEAIENQTYTGDALLPDVTIHDGDAELVKDADYTIIAIDGENQTTAGEAKILLTLQGNYTGTKVLTFTIEAAPVEDSSFELQLDDLEDSVYTGEVILPQIPVYLNGNLLTQNEDYVVEAINGKNSTNAGTAYAQVRLLGNYSGTKQFSFQIIPMTVAEDEIEISGIVDQPYSGEAIIPSVKVTVKGVTLGKSDYTVTGVSGKNNTYIGVGYANVVLTNNYSGSKEVIFTIKASVTLDSSDLTIEELADQGYTGKEIYPEIVLKYGATELILGQDYHMVSIDRENNTNLGEAKVRVELLNKYQGTKDVSFTIVPRELTKDEVSIAPIESLSYNRLEQLPALVMEYNEIALAEGKDYSVSVIADKNATEVGTAYAHVSFMGNFTGSFEVSYDIVKKELTASDIAISEIPGQTYTASEILPELTITDASEPDVTYIQGKDFEVTALDGENCTNVGSAKIAYQFIGNYSGEGTVEFTIVPKELTSEAIVVELKEDVVYTGLEMIPELLVTDGAITLTKDTDYTVTTVSKKNSTDAGAAYVLVTLQGNYSGSKEFKYEILAKQLEEAQITVESITNVEYTGEINLPDMTVKFEETVLVNGTDYSIERIDGQDNTFAGISKVEIVLKNNYAGSKTVSYEILQKNLNDKNTSFDAIENQIFNGSALTPDTGIYDGSIKLAFGTDYTLSGIEDVNNKNVGEAYVRAEFLGNYSGSIEMPFQIVAKELSGQDIFIQEIADIVYTGETITPDLVVKDGETVLTKDADYTVSAFEGYTNLNAGTGAITVTLCGNYSGSKSAQFTIVSKELGSKDVEIAEIADKYYTGSEILPDSTVMYGTKELIVGADYDIVPITNRDCINVGTAIIRYQFKGNYSGSTDVTFRILAHEVVAGNVRVIMDDTEVFTGGTIFPEMTVLYHELTLKAGTDYNVMAVQGVNSTNVGNAAVKIEFTGNYAGSKQVTFTIIQKELAVEDITISKEADITYTGEAIIPDIQLNYRSTVLKSGTDYTISSIKTENNTDVGSAKVSVKFKGNYKGSFEYDFEIIAKVLSEDEISIKEISDQVYTGETIIPVLVVKDGTTTLELEKDYVIETINGSNSKSIGEAYLNVSLKGNYSGSKQISFNIVRKNVVGSEIIITEFDDENVTNTIVIPDVIVYDGEELLVEGTDYTVEITKLPNSMNSIKVNLLGTHATSSNIVYNIISKTMDSSVLSLTKIADQTYNGNAIIPDVNIRYGKITLVEGEDYTLSSIEDVNNIQTGTAKVKVDFINNFSGSAELSFNIVSLEVEDENVTISNVTSPEFTGEEVLPELSVDYNGVVLKKGSDYRIEAMESENNVEVGQAKAKIVFLGNYSGSMEVDYTISRRELDDESIVVTSISEEVQTGSVVLPNVTLEFNGMTLVEGVDFELKLIEGLDYVDVGTTKVRVIFKGNFTGEMTVTYRIIGEFIESSDINVESSDVVFTNEKVTPPVNVTFNRVVDSEQVSYTIELLDGEDGVNVGEVKAKVVLKGYYSGSKEFTFHIIPKVLTETGIVLNYDSTIEYSGEEQLPANLSVSYGDWSLTEGVDFTVVKSEDADYVNIGEKTVTIQFHGNYEGTNSMELNYEIVEKTVESEPLKSLLDESITITSSTVVKYTGSAVFPKVVITDGTNTLTKDVDYTLTGMDNVNLGTATVVIEGIGAYTDSVTKEFTIKVGKVTSLAAKSATTTSITLSWTRQTGVTGYEVYYYSKTKKKYVYLKRITGNKNNSYTHSKLAKLTQYNYKVRAYKKVDGVRIYGSFSTILKTATAPAKVTSVKTVAGTNSIRLSWTKLNGVTGYEVYYYKASSKKYTLLKRVSGSKNVSYTHSKLSAGTSYQYKVRAYKTVNGKRVYGSFSAIVKTSTILSAPSLNVTAKSKSLVAKWSQVKGATGYEVYIATSKNGKYSLTGTVKGAKTVSYTVKSLKSKQTYYVKMRTYKTVNGKKVYSSYSKTVSVTVK